MNNAVATRPQDNISAFVGEVLPPDRRSQIVRSLPKHVNEQRFERNLVIAIAQHPKLLNCDPGAVFYEVSKAAALGLLLDPQLGEAYLITGWSKDGPAPQLRLGYRGMVKLARQSGDVKNLYAHEVCESDVFKVQLGTEKTLVHEPNFVSERGGIYAYYAVVVFSDGTTDFEIMSLHDIHRIRERSDGWRAFKEGKIKSTPWATDESEMAKKTVIRRLTKRLPMSPELADAIQIEDDAEYRGLRDAPAADRPALADRLSRHERIGNEGFDHGHAQRQIASARGDTGESVDQETGEIIDGTDGAPATYTAPAMSADEFREYSGVLARFGDEDKLKRAAAEWWKEHGGWPPANEADRAKATRIYDAHKNRVAGKISPEDAAAHVNDILEEGDL